jgi:hypothetical protein
MSDDVLGRPVILHNDVVETLRFPPLDIDTRVGTKELRAD